MVRQAVGAPVQVPLVDVYTVCITIFVTCRSSGPVSFDNLEGRALVTLCRDYEPGAADQRLAVKPPLVRSAVHVRPFVQKFAVVARAAVPVQVKARPVILVRVCRAPAECERR